MSDVRVAFKTVGCRLNQAETAAMIRQFTTEGYRVVPFGTACDVAVVHTCAVTHEAERKGAQFARLARREAGRTIVVLTGCSAYVNAADMQRQTGADLVATKADAECLPGILRARFGIAPVTLPPAPPPETPPPLPAPARPKIKVQDGCDFQCAYCIVPLARGPSVSRPPIEILDEIRTRGDEGHREVVLTGANLGGYRFGNTTLIDLLEDIERIGSIGRVRLSSIEPATGEREVIDFMASSTKLCRFLHIPLQSGDDRILAAMGRRYSVRDFRELVAHAWNKAGPLGLGTDLIVGLPGEDDASFAATLGLVDELPFSKLHVFQYSARPGTRAASMPDRTDRAARRRRAEQLMQLGSRKRQDFARQFVGRTVSVLVESVASGNARGWTAEYLPAALESSRAVRGDIASARVTSALGDALICSPSGLEATA